MNKGKTFNRGRRLSQRGHLFVLSAPSGAGKTTLANAVLSDLEGRLIRCITSTTRPPREGEENGKDYYFLSEDAFTKKKENQEFLEWAKVYDHYYGTDKKDVETILSQGKDLLLIIDVVGAMTLMEKNRATFIFITPPSMQELEKRIRLRESDSEESIKKRLEKSVFEMEKQVLFDYIMVNDDFLVAREALKSIIIADKYRNKEKTT